MNALVGHLALPARQVRLQRRPALEGVTGDGVLLDVTHPVRGLALGACAKRGAGPDLNVPVPAERLEAAVEPDLVASAHRACPRAAWRCRSAASARARGSAQRPPCEQGVKSSCRQGGGNLRCRLTKSEVFHGNEEVAARLSVSNHRRYARSNIVPSFVGLYRHFD